MAREYTFLDGLGKAASTQFYAIVGLLNPAARSSVEALRRYLPQARHRLLMLDAMDSLLGATTTERAAMEQVGPLIESLTLLRDSDAGALLELSPVMGRERCVTAALLLLLRPAAAAAAAAAPGTATATTNYYYYYYYYYY